MREPSHQRRILIAWIVLTVILLPIVLFLIAPNLPPGNATEEAQGQVIDNTVLLAVVTPIAAFLVVFFVYALANFRQRDSEPDEEGPAIYGDHRVQVTWLVTTVVIVLGLAAFGTFRLFQTGSGGGQGADPIFTADVNKKDALQVQVIAQQWEFTYRYPSYGGVETPHLVLPVNREIELHVTSLDVVHSFWAHALGVKADANPGVDNAVYLHTNRIRNFEIRCAELCGLWHGHMFDKGQVVSDSQFANWIHGAQRFFGPATKALPRYNQHYFPKPERRAG
jgi:cytochrome c oxidase subunit 2